MHFFYPWFFSVAAACLSCYLGGNLKANTHANPISKAFLNEAGPICYSKIALIISRHSNEPWKLHRFSHIICTVSYWTKSFFIQIQFLDHFCCTLYWMHHICFSLLFSFPLSPSSDPYCPVLFHYLFLSSLFMSLVVAAPVVKKPLTTTGPTLAHAFPLLPHPPAIAEEGRNKNLCTHSL